MVENQLNHCTLRLLMKYLFCCQLDTLLEQDHESFLFFTIFIIQGIPCVIYWKDTFSHFEASHFHNALFSVVQRYSFKDSICHETAARLYIIISQFYLMCMISLEYGSHKKEHLQYFSLCFLLPNDSHTLISDQCLFLLSIAAHCAIFGMPSSLPMPRLGFIVVEIVLSPLIAARILIVN